MNAIAKKTLGFWSFLFGISLLAFGKSSPSIGTTSTNSSVDGIQEFPTNYMVVARDGDSKILERYTFETAPDGKLVPKKHRLVEMAGGLNYLNNGQWTDSKEEIDIQSDGTAAATQGQHQVYFPSDIYSGVIKMVTPDGQVLQSRPVGISYDDGNNTVLIAELKDSAGELLEPNKVIYPDAFTGFKADLVCTYHKNGFECDVVFREQPPAPESFGLNSQNCRLQLLTEFFNTPEPETMETLPMANEMDDSVLRFGNAIMGRGKAFAVGDSGNSVPVSKSWLHLQNRTFLLEQLAYPDIAPSLQTLPASVGVSATSANSPLHKVSTVRLLTPSRLVQNGGTKPIQLAKNDFTQTKGYVLDYVILDSDPGDFTFQSDTTYYIANGIDFWDGTITFEGGTVIKYNTDPSNPTLMEFWGTVNCDTSPYRPAVITADWDNSVGEPIDSPGSTSGYYWGAFAGYASRITWHDLNMRYAHYGIDATYFQAYDCQFVNCLYPLLADLSSGGTCSVTNVLIVNAGSAFNGANFSAEGYQVTVNGCTNLVHDWGGYTNSTLRLTNSLLVNVQAFGTGILESNYTAWVTDTGGQVLQTVIGGTSYLVTNSPYRGAGTPDVSAAVLADVRTKTTYPPVSYDSWDNLTLGPQAMRDTNSTPDLGYHYDPIDYLINASVSVNFLPGTVVGFGGLGLDDGDSINFEGTATQPCWFVGADTVQEAAGEAGTVGIYTIYIGAGPISANFTKFSALPNTYFFADSGAAYPSWTATNCEFYGGIFDSGNDENGGISFSFKNCLFCRANIWDAYADSWDFQDCTFWNGNLSLQGDCLIQNTAFDGTTISNSNLGTVAFDYNAFLTNADRLVPYGTHDVTNLINYNWQTSWFGNFYLPTNSLLINTGSTNANLLGLYHFTTQTNQTEEEDSMVDMGYHYVALDQYGNVLDSNDNGIADWWELKYFGNLNHTNPFEDFDGDGHTILYDYQHGIDPNIINFGFFLTTPYFATNVTIANIAVFDGLPSSIAVLIDNTNFADAIWTNYVSSTVAINLGTNWGAHEIWVGLRGLPSDAQQTWQETKLFLVYPMVKAGGGYNVFLNQDGTVWAWGINDDGELGNGTWDDSTDLVQVAGISNIVSIAVEEGSSHTLALDSSKMVWAWGWGAWGQLGLDDGLFEDENLPTPVIGISNIVAIVNGRRDSVALKNDGTVWSWGDDNFGELGDGTNVTRDFALPVTNLTGVIAIASGDDHNFAARTNGTIWGWGYNEEGELGIGNTDDQFSPVQVTALTNITEMAGGEGHSLAISNGCVLAWGRDYFGQLGDETNGAGSTTPLLTSNINDITAVSAGDDHSLAIDTNGLPFAWGLGGEGQLGNGSQNSTNIPIIVSNITNVISIAGGYQSSIALTVPGQIYEWGNQISGQYLIPTQVNIPQSPSQDAANVTASFPDVFVNTNVTTANVIGSAQGMAILVGNTNFAAAQWIPFNSNPTVYLGTTDGLYQVWFGFEGLNGSNHWSEANVILDMTPPTLLITNPVNNAAFNASRVNVQGTFTETNLKEINVNGTPAFINDTNFIALNVPLDSGTNVIQAVAEDLAENFATNSITVIALTNSDGSVNDPIQLQATPTVGFSPLTVTFQITSNAVPGTFQQALYDFNGDGITDFVTNTLGSVTVTYTNGEYFPTVTIQTTAGFFSSSGGWNSDDPNRLQIIVQNPVTVLQTISVTDPVDLKWNGTNLYVLSGSSGTITEFDTNGTPVGSPFSVNASCSGFDMDSVGNIYVAVTFSNQVWKFNPSGGSFTADNSFGFSGFIGATNGATGTTNGQFNAPYDVAVSPDGGTISVSDSGNNRIQQFSTTDGSFSAAFGTNGTDIGQFNTPEGLTYDSSGTLYIVDSGNNRIALAQGTYVTSVTGTNGTAFGQFSDPININFGEHGVYVADAGNNRIQSFNSPVPHIPFSADPSVFRLAVATSLNQPSAVAARDDDLTTEKFYVADTGNNRVLLYAIAQNDPTSTWSDMTNHIMAGDIPDATSDFSIASQDDYQNLFLATGTSATISTISNIGALSPVYIDDDKAEYYFIQSINGQDIGFLVEFVKENGVWKILEF